MSAVSQSYPNYLGGLNEQPDELKKPGQLKEALNVIPDPTIGLTRRPGFKKIGGLTNTLTTASWFELEASNQKNDDYIYFGAVNNDGTVNIFNQDAEIQTVLYTDEPVVPHKDYRYIQGDNVLKVFDDNDELLDTHSLYSPTSDQSKSTKSYFTNTTKEPLKYCISKNQLIFTNPTKFPGFASYDQPNEDEEDKYYSFINLKVIDTANYNYRFKRFYSDDNKETYRYMNEIEISSISGGGDEDWDRDTSKPLETEGPFRFTIDKDDVDGVDDPAIIEVSFRSVVETIKSTGGDGYYNKVINTPNPVKIIYGGKGFKSVSFRKKIQDADNASDIIKDKDPLVLNFKITDTESATGTKYDSIDPGDVSDSNADEILISLRNAFESSLPAESKVLIVGTGLYLESTQPFSVATSEEAIADTLNAQKIDDDIIPIVRVNTVADLPVECYSGFIAQVSNSFSGDNDYYLKFRSESQSSDADVQFTKSDGYWEEIAKPYEPYKPEPLNMPHMITVANKDGESGFAFIVSPIEWEKRTAGTAKDNPSMFTDKTCITSVNYYKNRLFFFTRIGTVISSKAGQINNLFLETAINTSPVDPLDIIANSNQRVPIHGSSVINNGMVLFGDTEQYMLTTNSDILTTDTANITKVANYTFSPVSSPIYLGTNIGFISSNMTRFYEMTNLYDRGPVDINERSQQIASQFGKGFNMCVSSREQSSALVYKRYDDTGSDSLYLYRFRQENSQESSQSAWVKWSIGGVNKARPHFVIYASMPQDKIFLVVNTEDGNQLYRMDSSSADGLPASSVSVPPKFTDGYTDNNDGNAFTTKIVFPTIYALKKGATTVSDVAANLTIHRVKLSTAAIGAYDLTIDRKGYDTYNLLVEQTPADEYKANFPQLYGEKIETVPVYTRNKNLTLTMSTNYDAPMTLQSMTWEGDWNRPYYKSA